jgi:hypothetical protein
MNKLLLTSAFAMALVATASASNFSVSGAGASIPDAAGTLTWNVTYGGTPGSSTVVVANPVTSITKVRLSGFSHTWRGDLHILVKNPAGTIFNVAVRPGFTGTGFGDAGDYLLGQYDFVDAGGSAINQGATNISGGTYNIYQNTGAGMWTVGGAVNGPLSAITGAAGVWTLEVRDWAGGDIGAFTGWTLEGTDTGGGGGPVAFCDPGTGGVLACPCSNPPSGAGRGCENSESTGGASVTASGNSTVSADTLVFTSSNQTAFGTAILMQGDASNGTGVAFGQGVRCVDGNLFRLYVKSPGGTGGIVAPTGGDMSVTAAAASLGDTIVAGQHRYYMVYYRDPTVLGLCLSTATFNGTNALDVTWN